MKGCLATIFLTMISAVIVGHFARLRHHERIERILSERVSGIMEEFPEIDIKYDHFTARVTGEATKAELEEIRAQIDTLREGNGRVFYAVEMVRRIPSTFVATRENKKINLRGTVDSEQTKRDFEAALSLSGLAVENHLVVSDDVAPIPAFLSAIGSMPMLMRSAEGARLEVDLGQISVSGMVDTEEDKRILSGMFSAERWRGATIDNKLKVKPPPPPPEPLPEFPSLSWKQEGQKIILEGKVSSAAVKMSLIVAANDIVGKQGVVLEKDLKVAANVLTVDWLAKFPEFVVRCSPKITNPNFRLGPENSEVTATIVGSDVEEEFCIAFAAINPPGLSMNLKIVPRPRTKDPMIEITRTEHGIRINGTVPSQEIHDSIKKAFRGIEDSIAISDVVKHEPWLELVPDFIAVFHGGEILAPEFSLKGKKLTIRGEIPNENVRSEILAASRPLKSIGITIKDELTLLQPTLVAGPTEEPERQVEMDAKIVESDDPKPTPPPKMKEPDEKRERKEEIPEDQPPKIKERHQIFFGTGEYHIRSSEKKAVAAILERVLAAKGGIVIDGFADERGDPETNEYLSLERANRIRLYLIENGVDRGRITSVMGHGAQRGMIYPEARKTEVQIMEPTNR